jgi:hypothetical protein
MCTEIFTYEGLFERHFDKNMGLDLNDVEKLNIKGKILVSLKSWRSKEHFLPLGKAVHWGELSFLR